MHKFEKALLTLLAATVDHDTSRCENVFPLTSLEWSQLLDLASNQGVIGLAFSAVEHLPKEFLPDMDTMMEMFGQAEYQKMHYQTQFDTAQKFAKALNEKGVEMKVLKGIAFSTYYDHPELRECEDCDCYLSIKYPALGSNWFQISEGSMAGSTGFKIGNQTIEEIGGKGEFGSYKHSHLFLDNLMFENHHYITDFNGTRKGKKLEMLLEKAIDSTPGTLIPNSDMVRPCSHFCALHLLRHAQGNLMLGGMTLRMIYDWAVFLRAEQNNLDWHALEKDLEECDLLPFAGMMTGIVKSFFGLKLSARVIIDNDAFLTREIVLDTMRSQDYPIYGESLSYKFCRIIRRFKRMYRFRKYAIESVPMMIWNSFAYCSYAKRDINL